MWRVSWCFTAKDGSADLSIPFLATTATGPPPGMLDYATMLNEDTVPYTQPLPSWVHFTSSFAYRLGANLFVTMDGAEKTSLKAEHITISPQRRYLYGRRGACQRQPDAQRPALHFTVTNADGQEVWSDAVTNVPKTILCVLSGRPHSRHHVSGYGS